MTWTPPALFGAPGAQPDDPYGLRMVVALEEVELLNGALWLAGKLDRGHFRRLSDFVNHAHGRILLRDAVVANGSDPPGGQARGDAWIDPEELEIIGQRAGRSDPPPEDMAIRKRQHPVTAFTSSHQVRGTLHVHQDADVTAFIRADAPPLLVMTDAVVTRLSDGSVVAEFALALLSRRRTSAIMPE